MKAVFDSKCAACRKPIHAGDEIHYDHRGSKHARCRDRKTNNHREKPGLVQRIRNVRIFTLEDEHAYTT